MLYIWLEGYLRKTKKLKQNWTAQGQVLEYDFVSQFWI